LVTLAASPLKALRGDAAKDVAVFLPAHCYGDATDDTCAVSI